jgi:hypothetical protein
MATLYLTNLNPTAKIVDTKKKFFNRYLYKIVFHVPACRLVAMKSDCDISEQLEVRQKMLNTYQYGHGYNSSYAMAVHRDRRLIGANVSQLEYFKKIVVEHEDRIKIRIEEPFLTIYADDESLLLNIADPEKAAVTEFHRPSGTAAVAALNRGECIVKTATEYTHKVVFKELAIGAESKASIYNYLTGLGDIVKMTKGCERNLRENRFWFTTSYFYTKDESILTFLNLIAPGVVAGIYKLTVL